MQPICISKKIFKKNSVKDLFRPYGTIRDVWNLLLPGFYPYGIVIQSQKCPGGTGYG
jgi:hypothetical protein